MKSYWIIFDTYGPWRCHELCNIFSLFRWTVSKFRQIKELFLNSDWLNPCFLNSGQSGPMYFTRLTSHFSKLVDFTQTDWSAQGHMIKIICITEKHSMQTIPATHSEF